jgi:adenosine deaminase
VDSVAVLSQIIDLTEDSINEQTDEALSKTASFFEQLANFLDVYDVIVNKTVSANEYYSP